jgi:hypothetical protein
MTILNSFSLNMLASFNATIVSLEISLEEARVLAMDAESAVGHADTAAVFSEQLGVSVPANRINVSLKSGDEILVGQYKGPRLPEGAKTLPDGSTIVWCRVAIK